MFAQGLLADGRGRPANGRCRPPSSVAGREVPVSPHGPATSSPSGWSGSRTSCATSLITIAVGGAGCRPDVLSHVHGISRLHAAALGDALVDRHLVVESGGAYRCIHPVIAHLVRDALTASRRQEVTPVLALASEVVLPAGGGCRSRSGSSPGTPSGAASAELAYRLRADRRGTRGRRATPTRRRSAGSISPSSSARTAEQSQAVDRLTADVVETAGWSEAPPARRRVAGHPGNRERGPRPAGAQGSTAPTQ